MNLVCALGILQYCDMKRSNIERVCLVYLIPMCMEEFMNHKFCRVVDKIQHPFHFNVFKIVSL